MWWPGVGCPARIVAKYAPEATRRAATTATKATAATKAIAKAKGSEHRLHLGGHRVKLAVNLVELAETISA